MCEDFFDETCSEGLRELSDEWSLTSVEVRQSSKVKTAAPRPAQPAVARSAKAALPSV
ncbi:MAG TPA: hypothetical protein VJ276_24470 [Thermoanaerobaculia bacterium]|nr:hypothetical protein [Thermoanaerobaculia bacterium]